MRIIIDGHGRIDRQAMAVERLKTIDMTPAGGGDAQDWVGAWLDGFDQALDLCRALETALDADTGKELSGDARRRTRGQERGNHGPRRRIGGSPVRKPGTHQQGVRQAHARTQEGTRNGETEGARP